MQIKLCGISSNLLFFKSNKFHWNEKPVASQINIKFNLSTQVAQ